jgi:hypothetical protein
VSRQRALLPVLYRSASSIPTLETQLQRLKVMATKSSSPRSSKGNANGWPEEGDPLPQAGIKRRKAA